MGGQPPRDAADGIGANRSMCWAASRMRKTPNSPSSTHQLQLDALAGMRRLFTGVRPGRAVRRLPLPVESAWGAVPVLGPVRFPRPLAEPAVRISPQRALHGFCR